ncbi:MAG: hypothetical protein K8L99_23530 [Anaerolineae bacterium]|nr:hypothetical protein [Anaerolineae bacterium]
MSEKPLTTSWMWKDDNEEIWGMTINREKGVLEWADSIGCACGDSFAQQSITDFLEKGPQYGNPPQDVLDEIRATLHQMNR